MHFGYDEGCNDKVKSNYDDLRLHSDGSIGRHWKGVLHSVVGVSASIFILPCNHLYDRDAYFIIT